MCGNMIRFITFDFVLWISFGGMVSVALIFEVLTMDFYNPATYLARF